MGNARTGQAAEERLKIRDVHVSAAVKIAGDVQRNRRELLAASITSSSSNRIDLSDPRVAYYGWSNPDEVPTVFQLQDPREVSLSVTLEF